MTSKFNQRWIIAGTIWLATIVMSYWNFTTIQTVTKISENSEQLRREFMFQRNNAEKLLRVQSLYRSYYKPVASLKLGFESARSPLRALAALFGLKDVSIESQIAQATEDQIPFTMRMTGHHSEARAFAAALLKYPYIAITRSRIVVINDKGMAEIEMDFKFQFKIEAPEQADPESLQASAMQQAQEGNRQ